MRAAQIPVIAFISSGGMQTKEGAGALFPMAVVNDASRALSGIGQPVLCFGFGDCTGGAQASFVTHPLVQTYYFSGANMPFAGQIVVTEHLPSWRPFELSEPRARCHAGIGQAPVHREPR